MKLGEQCELRARSQPPLSAEQQLGDPVDAFRRALGACRRAAPYEQPRRLAPGLHPGDSDFGRRVADVDAGDKHLSDDAGNRWLGRLGRVRGERVDQQALDRVSPSLLVERPAKPLAM